MKVPKAVYPSTLYPSNSNGQKLPFSNGKVTHTEIESSRTNTLALSAFSRPKNAMNLSNSINHEKPFRSSSTTSTTRGSLKNLSDYLQDSKKAPDIRIEHSPRKSSNYPTAFVTATEKLFDDDETDEKGHSRGETAPAFRQSSVKRKFIPPSSEDAPSSRKNSSLIRRHPGKGRSHSSNNNNSNNNSSNSSGANGKYHPVTSVFRSSKEVDEDPGEEEEDIDPRLKSCDKELIEKIEMEIVYHGDPISFQDIAGLTFAKRSVTELILWPMQRPDIFTGLRRVPKGLLLFGPPGTGKTLIGKAIATSSGATFFNISASSLTSKWIGEGEKLVRTLFAVAVVKQPSVIFIDEIDSLLTQRSSEDNEASRRIKTEFLVQLDGAGTKSDDIVLVVGATNRPQELDEAARRRFVKRLYIPLPSPDARRDLIDRLLSENKHNLTDENKKEIVERTDGYSGADIRALCTDASMGPIRSCVDITTMDASAVRPISLGDFEDALRSVRPSVSQNELEGYYQWNAEFGSFQINKYDSTSSSSNASVKKK